MLQRSSPLVLLVAACLACRATEEAPSSAATDESELAAKIAQLEALGYVNGTDTPEEGRVGVTVHVPGRTAPGLNLVVSGHAHEAVLMDPSGRALHSWHKHVDDAFPGQKWEVEHFRRAHLFPNGDLLLIYARAAGLVKLDRCSNVLWKTANGAHHDFEVQPDGEVYVLVRKARVIPALHPEAPILEDFVAVLSPSGEERRRVSVLDALLRSPYAHLWDESKPREGDVFHTNSIQVLRAVPEGVHAPFRPGRVLLSSRVLNALMLLDMEEERIVWGLAGSFAKQHDAQLLPNGRVLLFDNVGKRGGSRILEVDPATGDIGWEYPGERETTFYSRTRGQVQRLPNGNTLVTETNAGRAFEIDAAGEIVWEYVNPERIGEEDELMAPLLDAFRLPPDLDTAWMTGCAE